MPTSEARIAANRLNALKSTGPRTEQGKERSRRNALKHGLTGEGVVVPEEDAAAVAERFEAFHREFAPATLIGSVLVKRIAMLSVRLDRSYRQEAAAIAVRVAGARAARLDEARAEAEHLLKWIAAEPATNSRRLHATPEGLDLMIAEFERMKADLDHREGTRWSYSHYHQADYLRGNASTSIDPSDYMCWTMALFGQAQHIRPDRLAGLDEAGRCRLALDHLALLLDADLDRLRRLRAEIDAAGHDAALELAPRVALFDGSKEAVLARKYEAACERGIYRAMAELERVEAGEAADVPELPEAPADPAPEPDPEPEPAPALGSSLPAAPPAPPEVAKPAPRRPDPRKERARSAARRPG